MIIFKKLNKEKPFQTLKEKYDQALNAGQKNIEAITISSYNKKKNEVDSRCVNLKFIEDKNFIFFSNYDSPKSKAFNSHDQISALFFWPSINFQIRMKARVKKTSVKYNKDYFRSRSEDKNALSISSKQSQRISSYKDIINKYQMIKNKSDLQECPDYWGGFIFTPYQIEFWEGNQFRLNKRDLYVVDDTKWNHYILEP